MTPDDDRQYAEYLAWINENHPEHDRTSCDDVILYNAGSVMLRHRCERCESLDQLKTWRIKREYTVEREVSDKLEKALKELVDTPAVYLGGAHGGEHQFYSRIGEVRETARAALAEVGRLRSRNTPTNSPEVNEV